jgi:DNA-binding GntR family transcriptional regulator
LTPDSIVQYVARREEALRVATDDPSETVIEAIETLSGDSEDANGYEPLGQAIARRVRDAILSGRLKPGSRIRQEALAHHLGVSRIPVREALRQLENEGLVTLIPHSGARVARLDIGEHLELYRIREALEPLAIAASAPNLTDEQLVRLSELLEDIEECAGDPLRWLDYDRRFHLESYAAAGQPRMLKMIEGFWNTTQHYRRAFLETLDAHHMQIVSYEHRLILDALDRRDPVDAEMRQRAHIRRTRITLTAHGDVFDTTSADPPSKETTL